MKLHALPLLLILLLPLFGSPVKAQKIDASFRDPSLTVNKRAELLVSQMTVDEQISQLVNGAAALPRFEIPEYDWWNEALHGIARNGKATIFPQGIGLGASFDPELANRVASAISTEARAKYAISQEMGNRGKYAGLTFWTPNVNLFRDPRWGRGQETYGEDPLLMSKIGVAFVKGLQGDDPNYLKTAACAKHFAVHSGPEELRHHFDVSPSKQDLYESYLPAFEALVVDAKVEGVMGAYNAVYGKPACASPYLLNDLLKEDWGFDGYIVSDCGAVGGIQKGHHAAESPEEAAALALKAGVNLNCGYTYNSLKGALEQGLITEELLHERCMQLFKTRFRLGMLDAESNHPWTGIGPEKIHCKEHIELAREVAQKSIVLLKNEGNVLPLPKDIRVPYVTGPFANSADMLMGNYYGVSPNLVTILEGIADAVSLGTSLNYRSGALPFHENLNPLNYAPFVAAQSDVTICVVGLSADREGEEVDAIAAENKGDKKDLRLPQGQINYIHELIKHKKGPLILVIASGSPVSLEGIDEHCAAILQVWYPGEQGGNAVADVLFGDVSPSGHLPITFPKRVDQLPPYEDYSMQGRTYKYMTEEPLFPFGFGLSYSQTSFEELQLSSKTLKAGKELQVSFEVKNTGNYDIEEVVQLYVSPMDTTGNLPLASLKAFQRLSLKKGEQKSLTFTLPSDQFKIVNQAGDKVWQKGDYRISVGNCSPGERGVELGAASPLEGVVKLN